jgi:branched-subunit amino acid transport protein
MMFVKSDTGIWRRFFFEPRSKTLLGQYLHVLLQYVVVSMLRSLIGSSGVDPTLIFFKMLKTSLFMLMPQVRIDSYL